MSRARTLLLPFVVFAVSGCASVGFVVPEVTLVNVAFEDLTVFETSGTLTVRLANENREPLTVDGGVFQLYLGGLKIGKGLSDDRVEIPRLASATVDVDLFVNNLVVATRVARILEERVVDYRLEGKLYIERPVGSRRARFRSEGRWEIGAAGDGRLDALDGAVGPGR